MSEEEKKPEGEMHNFCSLKRELDEVTNNGGSKVLTQLFLSYFLFIKAASRDWIQNSFNVYYLNVLFADSNTANIMYSVYSSPFGVKTLWGSLSDALPCFGYHKKYYILWGVSVSVVCASMLAILFPEGQFSGTNPAPYSVVILVTMLFFGFDYGNATCDSLTQARYTEFMKMMGKPTIVSFVWCLISSCTLFSAFGNVFIAEGSYKILLWPAVICALPMLGPVSLNWLAEPPAKTFCTPETEKVTKHKGYFVAAMMLAFGVLFGNFLALVYGSSIDGQISVVLPYYAFASLCWIVGSKFVLHPDIWGPSTYMFLCSTLTLYFSGTLQGFYTFRNEFGLPAEQPDPCFNETTNLTEPDCQSFCQEGLPGFSTAYYQTVGQFLGAVAQLVAVLLFDRFIVKWKTRPAFWITTFFRGAAALLELALIERWNHRLFGTTPGKPEDQWVDQIFFLVGAQAVYKIVDMLDFMPSNVLIGNMCPPGMEATIFASLAGSQNFGQSIAVYGGGVVMSLMGVVYDRNFEACANPHVAWAGISAFGVVRVLAGIGLPIITIPLTWVLLPDKLLAEKYEFPIDEGDVRLASPSVRDSIGGVELTGAGEDGAPGVPTTATRQSLMSGGILSSGVAAKTTSRLF